MRKIKAIILHHSLTPRQNKPQWKAIRRYHMKHNGWSDVGYHHGMEIITGPDGNVVVIEHEGRKHERQGAHVKGMNEETLGVCVIGNYDNEKVPKRLWEETLYLVKRLQRMYDVPTEMVLGHWEAQKMQGYSVSERKSCPGTKFSMQAFRRGLL